MTRQAKAMDGRYDYLMAEKEAEEQKLKETNRLKLEADLKRIAEEEADARSKLVEDLKKEGIDLYRVWNGAQIFAGWNPKNGYPRFRRMTNEELTAIKRDTWKKLMTVESSESMLWWDTYDWQASIGVYRDATWTVKMHNVAYHKPEKLNQVCTFVVRGRLFKDKYGDETIFADNLVNAVDKIWLTKGRPQDGKIIPSVKNEALPKRIDTSPFPQFFLEQLCETVEKMVYGFNHYVQLAQEVKS